MKSLKWLIPVAVTLAALMLVGVGCDTSDDTTGPDTTSGMPASLAGSWTYSASLVGGTLEPQTGTKRFVLQANGDWQMLINEQLFISGTSTWETSGGQNHIVATITQSPMDPSMVGDEQDLTIRYGSTWMSHDYTVDGEAMHDMLTRSRSGSNAVHGILFTQAGLQARAGVTITATPASGTAQTATTNAHGCFLFENLPAGVVHFTASVDGFADVDQAVSALSNTTLFISLPLSVGGGDNATVNCIVVDENDDPLGGVLVALNDGQNATTDDTGLLSFTVSPGACVISATKDGYIADQVMFTAVAGQVYEKTLQLYPETSGGTGTLHGRVADSQTGEPIENVFVQSNDTGESTLTDADGLFSLEVTAGVRPMRFTAGGYIVVTEDVYVPTDGNVEFNVVLSPSLSDVNGVLRFVLSWNEEPSDLDSYLATPEIDGSEHLVCYWSTGDSTSAPFATLDIDDTDGYGPETITVYQLSSGTYKYYVNWYYGDIPLPGCGARVQIYDTDGLVQSLVVPTEGEGEYWYVCDVDGDNGTISVVNQVQADDPGGITWPKRVAK